MTKTLTSIPGVGATRAKKLSDAGYTLKKLQKSSPETVAKKSGIPESVAKKAVAHAQSQTKKATPPPKPNTSPSNKSVEDRLHILEQAVTELTKTMQASESRFKRFQQDFYEVQHQLDYLSWDALPRVVHELAWYIKTHLASWSDEKIFDWLKDHGHEDRHIKHALSIARA